MTRPDPFITWPKPIDRWSSVHAAAEACWSRAEATRSAEGGVDPRWRLYGAVAYALDLLEEVRKDARLPMDATIEQVMAARPVTVDSDRVKYVKALIDYAIRNEVEP